MLPPQTEEEPKQDGQHSVRRSRPARGQNSRDCIKYATNPEPAKLESYPEKPSLSMIVSVSKPQKLIRHKPLPFKAPVVIVAKDFKRQPSVPTVDLFSDDLRKQVHLDS